MINLKYNDIYNILLGATFMASGGGGPLDIALNMLNKFKNSTVCMYNCEDQNNETDYAIIIAAMGVPTEVKNRDFNTILNNTFNYMKSQLSNKNILYCMPVEYGGFNTFVPIYLALINQNIKLIDADGSGRAVPGLNTTLVSLNQCDITPFVMSNETNDCISISLNNSKDATECENICRNLCASELYNSISGIAGWTMNKSKIKDYAVTGSLSKAKLIGETIKGYQPQNEIDIFTYLSNKLTDLKCKPLASNKKGQRCKISKVEMNTEKGFDVGTICIDSTEAQWKISFINESLVIYKNGLAYMTAPDLICIFDDEKNIPLTNDYIFENRGNLKNRNISLGIIKVDDKWWKDRTEQDMTQIWRSYFDAVNYSGNCINYKSLT